MQYRHATNFFKKFDIFLLKFASCKTYGVLSEIIYTVDVAQTAKGKNINDNDDRQSVADFFCSITLHTTDSRSDVCG